MNHDKISQAVLDDYKRRIANPHSPVTCRVAGSEDKGTATITVADSGELAASYQWEVDEDEDENDLQRTIYKYGR
jgi:hypothetical protein